MAHANEISLQDAQFVVTPDVAWGHTHSAAEWAPKPPPSMYHPNRLAEGSGILKMEPPGIQLPGDTVSANSSTMWFSRNSSLVENQGTLFGPFSLTFGDALAVSFIFNGDENRFGKNGVKEKRRKKSIR